MEVQAGRLPTLIEEVKRPIGSDNGEISTDPLVGPLNERTESLLPNQSVRLTSEQLAESRLVTQAHEAFESMGVIRRQILNELGAKGWRKLGIVSALPGDGKTCFAINTAISLAADMGRSCLLVDCDLRSPRVAEYLAIETQLGIDDCLLSNLLVEEALIEVVDRNLAILPCNQPMQQSAEWMASAAMTELVEATVRQPDDPIVVFDLPPLLSGDDAIGFIKNLDAVVIVVADGQTSKSSLKRLSHLLGSTPVVGVVLNKALSDPFREQHRYG